jgi:hypothetical protein
MKKKPYFCQNAVLGNGHKAKYFYDLIEARNWLMANGGGTIKQRNVGIANDPYIGKISVWGVIETVTIPNVAA